jgi:hypothetical protein
MSSSEAALREAVDAFVEQIRVLIQRATLESVHALLGGSVVPARRELRASGPLAALGGRAKGVKRKPEELRGLVRQLHGYVAKNPGQRIEQIGRGLGLGTRDLALPVKKLLRDRKLSTKGQRRATKYFAK